MSRQSHSIQSLTDDILAEIEQEEQHEKTASVAAYTPRSEMSQGLMKIASDLRAEAAQREGVSYEDLQTFMQTMAGETTR